MFPRKKFALTAGGLLSAAIAVACTTAQAAPDRAANSEARMQKLLEGKVAGPAEDCLPTYRTADMVTIDDRTILFRDGSSRVYVNHPRDTCSGLSTGWYTLVTRGFAGARLCRGDIAHVTDIRNGAVVGGCVLGDFVPYTRP